ncbi:hypothetical protein DM02DRAFT_610495 [Periconia macrospinosa]|uniref:Uncharacterized protein n=1 Tax=Periconia macrospinosa TaxID=97972 RepID=A0A2V1E5G0_9PLEO|nr:hypothetical protein DM02DRAFT_610495 [Periconia macrospinosa]
MVDREQATRLLVHVRINDRLSPSLEAVRQKHKSHRSEPPYINLCSTTLQSQYFRHSEDMFRQHTNKKLQSASEAQRRPTFPSEVSTGRVQDKFPAYEDFPWEKIEEYFKTKWPNWDNFNAKHVSPFSRGGWQDETSILIHHVGRWATAGNLRSRNF